MIRDEMLRVAGVIHELLGDKHFNRGDGGRRFDAARDQALAQFASAVVAAIQQFEGREPGCLRIVLGFPDDRLTLPQPH